MKIGPAELTKLIKLIESYGYSRARSRGSHISFVKDGAPRPIVLPVHGKTIPIFIVVQICNQHLRITRDEYIKRMKVL